MHGDAQPDARYADRFALALPYHGRVALPYHCVGAMPPTTTILLTDPDRAR